MTDGNGIPIAHGGIISGNHNDLFKIVPQYAQMIRSLNDCGTCVENSIQNADKGFGSKKLRRELFIEEKCLPTLSKTNETEKRIKEKESDLLINKFINNDLLMNVLLLGSIVSERYSFVSIH